MIIQNSTRLLNELSEIESKITSFQEIICNQDLNIDSVKLLEDILKNYCREGN